MKTALITGASSGIGYELAKIMAADGVNLVLAARNMQKLETLQTQLTHEFKINVFTVAIDLSVPEAAVELFNFIRQQNIKIDYLVNNAGFGLYGNFYDTEWHREAEMIQLNITALTQLTKLLLPEMIKNGGGKIMNVASTAAFVPGPLMAVYYATKAFVKSFSEAIAEELKDKNVTVTVLCPGPTQTGFEKTAKLEGSKLFKVQKIATAQDVAKYGYKAMLKGEVIAVHGILNKTAMLLVKFSPRRWVRKAVKKISAATN